MREMRRIGLSNVHAEGWQGGEAWRRISAGGEITAPERRALHVASMGWTGSTTKDGVEGEVVVVERYKLAEEMSRNAGKWKGKILLLTASGLTRNFFRVVVETAEFARVAERVGALAIVAVDSPGTLGTTVTHIDPLDFSGKYFAIPMAAIAFEDRVELERQVALGPVRVKLKLRNRLSGGALHSAELRSANVVGEILGAVHPGEIVVVGAHLDSWDLGEGALDDGFGVATVLQAAADLVRSGKRPGLTIRFVLFTGEEQGIAGSRAYVRRHAAELGKHYGALICDQANGPIVGLQTNGRADVGRGAGLEVSDSTYFFSDALAFTLAGVPGIDAHQKSPEFAAVRHSEGDVFSLAEASVLESNGAAVARVAMTLANAAGPLPARRTVDEIREFFTRNGALEFLMGVGLWPY